MTPTLTPIKHGDSFQLACIYKQAGIPTDVSGFDIASQLRDSTGELVATLTVVVANQETSPGGFVLSATDTTSWPIDLLSCDIEFTQEGQIRSTQTFLVAVEPDITRLWE